MAAVLRHEALGWVLVVPAGIDPQGPGIVELRVEGREVFVIQATAIARAVGQYEDSVWRLRQGLPHRVGDYRAIHRALAAAADDARRVTVTVLEACDRADLAARKRHWAAVRGGGA